ncbi:hypothetical protein [Pseudomonas umsongensis]|uniref:hypothetical protein n=1 Tax=Pseudomonas umsongensis TaxID=198618 RepID=UPI003D7F9FF8
MSGFSKQLAKKLTIYAGALGGCWSALGWCLEHAESFKNVVAMFQSPDAEVRIDADSKSLNVGDTQNLVITVYPSAQHKLPPGTVTVTSSSSSLKVVPNAHAVVGEISGSGLIEEFKVRAVSFTDAPIQVSASYRTGDLERNSTPITFSITPKPATLKPHFERTDTKRVILAGEWEMVLGANSGVLKLVQSESKLTGSFDVPHHKWKNGRIAGSKDGNTFRMDFLVPSKSTAERLWVVGDYVIEKESGSIQMRGCAYHLRNAPDQRVETGAQGLDCSTAVKFPGWKTLRGEKFMATASFDFGSDY